MCQFVYLVLPRTADMALIGQIASEYQKTLRPVAGRPANEILEPGEALYRTASGACDCGTCLGIASSHAGSNTSYESEMQKRHRLGWSPAKIERWLRSKQAANRKQKNTMEADISSRSHEIERWRRFLGRCATITHPQPIGLLLTWEGGSKRDIRNATRTGPVPIIEVTLAFLTNVKENCVYDIRATSPPA
jgi:hypothetical protein